MGILSMAAVSFYGTDPYLMAEKKPSDLLIRKDTEQGVDPRVDLAVERTELALERTQLAWIRTLLSMIGGGFVIDRAMEALHKARLESGQAWVNHGHLTGMIFTGLGTFLMVLVTINYFLRASKLARMKGGKKSFLAPGFLLSALTILIGILLLYFINIS
jgi:putative membrane protein